MSLFKNEVGRPSNETKRKRRIFYSLVVLLGIITVGIGSFALYNTLTYQPIEGNNKNAIWSLIDKILNVGKNAEDVTNKKWVSYETSNGITLYYTQPKPDPDLPMSYYTEWYVKADERKHKNLYSNLQVIINGKSMSLGCKEAPKTPQHVPAGVPENGTIRFVFNVYSDSKCTRLVSGMETSTIKQDSYPKLIVDAKQDDIDGNYMATTKTVYPIWEYNGNKTYYYTAIVNTIKLNEVASATATRRSCSQIKPNATDSLLGVNANSNVRSEIVYAVYSDKQCTIKLKSDTLKIKTGKSEFVVGQPKEKLYKDAEVFIYYRHNYYKDLYVKATNYNNGKVSYNYKCTKFETNKEKSLSFYVNKKEKNKYSVIEVFNDSNCRERIGIIKTSEYKYLYFGQKGKITKTKFSYEAKKN